MVDLIEKFVRIKTIICFGCIDMKRQNKFIDMVLYVVSFFANFGRTFFVLVGKNKEIKKGSFLKSLDFIFRLWPNYFWKKPRLMKITGFLGMFIQHIFYNNKK